jgi:hypothetical protein
VKRRLTKLVVFLLLGAIVNVAVAWGCAARRWSTWPTYSSGTHLPDKGDLSWWHDNAPDGFVARPAEVAGFYGLGTSTVIMVDQQIETSTSAPSDAIRYRAGLPMRTFEGSTWVDMKRRRSTMQHAVKIWGDRPPIPLQLLWVGFAINTIFYGVLLWLAMLGLLRARRVRRRKRGLCIKCGYDLRGTEHEVCPECGATTR